MNTNKRPASVHIMPKAELISISPIVYSRHEAWYRVCVANLMLYITAQIKWVFQCIVYHPAIHCLPLSVYPLWSTQWAWRKKKLLHFLNPSFVAFICRCMFVWRVYIMSKYISWDLFGFKMPPISDLKTADWVLYRKRWLIGERYELYSMVQYV